MEQNTTLVLEGGALRGIYTSGVLDVFMAQKLWFPNVVGVSAGALNSLSYLSRQPFRSVAINLNHVRDTRYMGVSNWMHVHHYFNLDFLFGEISDSLMPFDYQTFFQAKEHAYVVATNCRTGKPEFFEKSQCPNFFAACKASASMPLLSTPIRMNGIPYLDGGVSNPVPLPDELPFDHGKVVLILTRQKGYRKKPIGPAMCRLYRQRLPRYPDLVNRMIQVPQRYNQRMERIDQLEKQGKIFVIRPQKPILVSRTEKNVAKLISLYQQGCAEAKLQMEKLRSFLAE